MKAIRSFVVAVAVAGTLGSACVRAQERVKASEQTSVGVARPELYQASSLLAQDTHPAQGSPAADGKPSATSTSSSSSASSGSSPAGQAPGGSAADSSNAGDQEGKQPKRILGIIPNYRAVSANTQLPPLNLKQKFWLATQDTFDYSDFVFVGALAGIAQAEKSQPAFGQGGVGYGRYYWHLFVDSAIENYMTEAIVPALTKEDPRYYTLAKGGFAKRTGYAVSRLFITRTDGGKATFNVAEIVGAGAAAGIGNAYYPAQSNPWVKTYQRWGTQVALDGVFNVLKEFWPDINQAVFHGKY